MSTPLVLLALQPKTDADRENLIRGIQRLSANDPDLSATVDQQTGDLIIGGRDVGHLEIILDRLKRESGVAATVGRPQVAYRETITGSADGEMKYSKHSEGGGQYAHVKVHLLPLPRGSGCIVENDIIGGTIPSRFIKAIHDGIREACARGVLGGHPVDDVKVVLYDGSYHEIDSSEMAFKIAASMAFQDAARKARPVLLEPVMRLQVSIPADYVPDVAKNLFARRGERLSEEPAPDGMRLVRAFVPLSEMFGYETDLRSRTRGSGTYTLELDSYQPARFDPAQNNDEDVSIGAPLKPLTPRLIDSIALPEPDKDLSGGQ